MEYFDLKNKFESRDHLDHARSIIKVTSFILLGFLLCVFHHG